MKRLAGCIAFVLTVVLLISCVSVAFADDFGLPNPEDDPHQDLPPDENESGDDDPNNPEDPNDDIVPEGPPLEPDPFIPPSPEPTPEPTPDPFPEIVPVFPPEDPIVPEEEEEEEEKEASEAEQLSWPASATAYDFTTGYSEDRARLIQIALSQVSAEEDPLQAGGEEINPYEQWLIENHPEIAPVYGLEGWNPLFLCWCAAQVGLTDSRQFPVTVSAEDLEFFLLTHGHMEYGIEEYRAGAGSRHSFTPGNILFLPIIGDDDILFGWRVGLVSAADGGHIEVVCGDEAGTVAFKTFSMEDITAGSELIGAKVIEFKYLTVAEVLFNFCINELGLNEAASCGVLANALAESGFSPEKLGDNGFSIGLFQWQGPRRTSLNAYCEANGLNPNLVSSQLIFFKYELETLYPKTYEACRGVENTAQGAAIAAGVFCRNFEAPYHRYWNGKQRALTAEQTVWPLFNYRSIS